MYETLMLTLRGFFGGTALTVLLLVAVGLNAVALAAWAAPAYRRRYSDWTAAGGWKAIVASVLGGLVKAAALLLLARLLTTAMTFQANQFQHQHGRITERNRSAVLMKWGSPHEQRELTVSHTRPRTWITRQLQTKVGDEERVSTDGYWKDEERPVQALGGRMPVVLSVTEEEREVPVEQKSLVSADVAIVVRNRPRTLGNANYAGYEDEWRFSYVVANPSAWRTTASMSFALPAETGLFDGMVLSVGGSNMLDTAESSDGNMVWRRAMPPRSQCSVELAYRSRGLEHLRYIPRRMTQTGHYRVAMTVEGVSGDKLDYPIGSMPAAEDLASQTAQPVKLSWTLDNALTSYDIGIKLPEAEQPNYHFARLLREAPVGLALLLALLTVPAWIVRRPLRLELAALMGGAYLLHYTFMGRLADAMDGFAGPFAISAAVMTALVVWLRLRDRDSRLLRVQDAVGFAVMVIAYPLAVVDADRTEFWMQFLQIGFVAYAAALLLAARRGKLAPDA
jgi:hypothetical protein